MKNYYYHLSCSLPLFLRTGKIHREAIFLNQPKAFLEKRQWRPVERRYCCRPQRSAFCRCTQQFREVISSRWFFANAAIKVLMPEEAKKVESTLRSMGMGKPG